MRKAVSSDDLLEAAKETLSVVEFALKELLGSSDAKKLPATRNLLAFGGVFIRQIHGLRRHSIPLDRWFVQHQKNMNADPMIRSLHELRRDLLDRATNPAASLHITQLHLPSKGGEHGPRPRNARSFFVGDRLGGTGWEVALSDGSVEKYYVAIPGLRPTNHHFDEGAGDGFSIELLARQYANYLREMLAEVEKLVETLRHGDIRT